MGYITPSELADLIDKGMEIGGAVENPSYYLHSSTWHPDIQACAMGLAYIGLVGNAEEALKVYLEERRWDNESAFTFGGETIAKLLNIPWESLKLISIDHYSRTPAKEISRKLREGEYEWNQNSTE